MLRPFMAIAAAAIAAFPAAAANYSAQLSAPATQRIIARNIVWNCGPAACLGSTEYSRPAVVCESLAKRAGRVDSFIVNGRAFAPAQLERCNSVAKDESPAALATR